MPANYGRISAILSPPALLSAGSRCMPRITVAAAPRRCGSKDTDNLREPYETQNLDPALERVCPNSIGAQLSYQPTPDLNKGGRTARPSWILRRLFAYAAHEFICRHPPECAVLAEYGGRFPDFLAAFAPCRELVYLADVARLEWLMNVAANAAHANPIAAMTLADVAAEDAPRLTLQLHPSFGFVASRWPIDRIWRANRLEAAAEATIDLAAAGVWLEVSRVDANVIMRSLDPATFAFRSAVQRGETLALATEVALVADPAFDLCRALPALFLDGAIIAVSLAEPHPGREPRQ